MPDKKITELTAYTTPVDTDVLPVVDVSGNETKKVTKADLLKALKDVVNNMWLFVQVFD